MGMGRSVAAAPLHEAPPQLGGAPPGRVGLQAGDEVRAWVHVLGQAPVDVADADRVDLIGALERLKSAAAAMQARLAAAMADEHVARASGERARTQAVRSVAGQVGLARRVSPSRAMTFVGLARLLSHDLPETLVALAAGEISEWQAVLVGREAAVLSSADRAALDAALAPRLGPLGDRGVAQEARRLVDRVDPGAVARRVRRAEADRCVTVRPAPGPAGCAMARLTATLPVAQAVAVYAGLRAHAEAQRNQHGDQRGIGQLMSDELVARLTARPGAAGSGTAVGRVQVEVGLVMSERSLLRGGADPAVLTDDRGRTYGHVPAFLARRLVRDADRAWLTRLYAAPGSGQLVTMDARRRAFSGRLRRLVVWRDQTCRMPWCEAPVRHADHVRAHAAGGATALANAAGLCEACNYVKESDGWRAGVVAAQGHVIEFTTPTGHRYRSQPPPAPGHHPRSLDEHVELLAGDWDDECDVGRGGAA
jgi:hypothetical protein